MTETTIMKAEALSTVICNMLERYFESVPQNQITNLYDMLFEQIEPALFEAVMKHCKYNQSRAAKLLGLSRGTCRMKLIKYFGEQYCGHRET